MQVDAAVIGGGIVGLACAAEVARRGKTVVLLERHRRLGTETTSRNSEVIHAGLYYPPGSLKATTCVRGAELLYAWCAARGVPHARCGKLVVAVEEGEVEALTKLARNAAENGARVELVGAARARELEPDVRCVAALRSPNTGIVDSHALVASVAAEVAERGGVVAAGRRLIAAEERGDGWKLTFSVGEGTDELVAGRVVNAAGLFADRVAGLFGVAATQTFMKGSYFRVRRRLVRSLVYPMPPPDGSLGIHATVDLAGGVRLGPDATRAAAPDDYDVADARRGAFFAAGARYLPGLREDDLSPDLAGIRPKITGGDFVLRAERGAVHLLGIESPGLTASLALAERVVEAVSW